MNVSFTLSPDGVSTSCAMAARAARSGSPAMRVGFPGAGLRGLMTLCLRPPLLRHRFQEGNEHRADEAREQRDHQLGRPPLDLAQDGDRGAGQDRLQRLHGDRPGFRLKDPRLQALAQSSADDAVSFAGLG